MKRFEYEGRLEVTGSNHIERSKNFYVSSLSRYTNHSSNFRKVSQNELEHAKGNIKSYTPSVTFNQ